MCPILPQKIMRVDYLAHDAAQSGDTNSAQSGDTNSVRVSTQTDKKNGPFVLPVCVCPLDILAHEAILVFLVMEDIIVWMVQ
jgi:hypothetical protein